MGVDRGQSGSNSIAVPTCGSHLYSLDVDSQAPHSHLLRRRWTSQGQGGG